MAFEVYGIVPPLGHYVLLKPHMVQLCRHSTFIKSPSGVYWTGVICIFGIMPMVQNVKMCASAAVGELVYLKTACK